MKDMFGTEVQIGDFVLSAPKSGRAFVGPVTKVRESNVTIFVSSLSPIYAYEHGAPSTFTKSTRFKRDENGMYIKGAGGGWEREEYDYESKDYTVVGQRRVTRERVSAYTVLVLRKFDGSTPESLEEKLKP